MCSLNLPVRQFETLKFMCGYDMMIKVYRYDHIINITTHINV